MIGTTDVLEATESIRKRVPWRRIGNAIGLLVLIAVVVPFVIYAVPAVAGGDGSYVVLSGSMEPAISPGDVIVVESVEPSEIQDGDVITYARGGEEQTTTHRVTEVNEGENGYEFQTKGDANEDPDREPVSGSQVEGRVMTVGGHLFVIPFIGHVIQFAGTPLGFASLVVAPLSLFVLSEVWGVVSSNRGDPTGDAKDGEDGDESPLEMDDGVSSGPVDEDGRESPGSVDSADSSESWVTLRADELKLGLVVTSAFMVYSVWIVYNVITFWSVGVAAGVTTTFLLLAGLYVSGRAGGTDDRSQEATVEEASEPPTGKTVEPAADTTEADGSDGIPSLEELWRTSDSDGSMGARSNDAGADPPATDGGTQARVDTAAPVDDSSEETPGGSGDD